MYTFCKKHKYFFKKNFFFFNLVLQQMDNHIHQVKKEQMTNIQNMCWVPFLVRILDSTVFTRPQKEKLI